MQERLKADLKTAMLAGNKTDVSILRGLLSALQSAALENRGELNEEQAEAVLRKEQKKREEAAELYEKAGDQERAGAERYEAELIARYLPEPLSDTELASLVDQAVAEAGDNPNMGQLIGMVVAKSEGRADGKRVAALVRERLQS